MKIIVANCPACGGAYDGPITGGIMTCEYCGTRFALDDEELEMLSRSAGADLDGGYEGEEEFVPMNEFARDVCSKFLKSVGDSEFQPSDKILKGLGIDGDEEVFLIHDDTLFKSGKNGFAITDCGFYCRELAESEIHYLTWGEMSESGKPVIDGSYIKVDSVPVAYFTGNSNTLEELRELYRDIRKYAKKFDWV